MCHVDYTCPRCGQMKMQRQYNIWHCLRCGRVEGNGPPWASRDRRKGERRDTKTFSEAMSFKRAESPVPSTLDEAKRQGRADEWWDAYANARGG